MAQQCGQGLDMRIARWVFVGTVLQMGLLCLFILTARVEPSGLAKSVVVVLSFFAMSALLAHAARDAARRALLWICLLLAIGYVLAFHALGLLLFPSLLKDVDGWSMHYLFSVLRVTAVLFAAYLSWALVLRLARVRRVVEVVPWRIVFGLLMLVGVFMIATSAWRQHAGH